ncbi:hypothetical protein CYK13_07085 [Streptococcus anginosus]|nr:hypothetical protein CYK13_07085 [Streptococcus anginosus]
MHVNYFKKNVILRMKMQNILNFWEGKYYLRRNLNKSVHGGNKNKIKYIRIFLVYFVLYL